MNGPRPGHSFSDWRERVGKAAGNIPSLTNMGEKYHPDILISYFIAGRWQEGREVIPSHISSWRHPVKTDK